MTTPIPKRNKTSEATWRNIKSVKQELLVAINGGLGPDELRVVLRVVRRLGVGFKRYGEMRLIEDPKDYGKEAFEELLDWIVYNEMDIERKAQEAAKKKRVLKKYLATGSV